MVPPLDPMTSPVKVIWPDGHTCIIGPWVQAYLEDHQEQDHREWTALEEPLLVADLVGCPFCS